MGRFRVGRPVEDVFVGDVKPIHFRADVIAHGIDRLGHPLGDEVAGESDDCSQRQTPQQDASDVGAEQSGHRHRSGVRGQERVHGEHRRAHR